MTRRRTRRSAIEATLDDLGAGRPMDRLVCGDVGFGKTEVALRAAFAAGDQRQADRDRRADDAARAPALTPISRSASPACRSGSASSRAWSAPPSSARPRRGSPKASVDIVVGTHAVLGKTVGFKDLGLVVIDEEQHFGVGHKERLKELRAEVHVLTLSATPIPRTLQLAMTGVRDLSIIATPPVDRLAVRTFVSPFDALIVREALLRERYRGGQSFYVCPRIEDLDECAAFLRQNVPEAQVRRRAWPDGDERTRGQDRRLLRRQIRHPAVDLDRRIRPRHSARQHADRASRRHVRPRRSSINCAAGSGARRSRAYAIFTTPAGKPMTPQAEKRLTVLQSLDTLGAGFQLASHDLDLRGAGNLLGEEQSGHIKEVGYELYQQMVQDAVERLKAGVEEPAQDMWSPTISLGSPVTIPEGYIPDLTTRLSLYRRLSALENEAEIEAMGAEIVDRFGPPPPEVDLLMKLVRIKALCRRAHVEKLDAGAKGLTLAFRDNSFANPTGLVKWVTAQGSLARVRPDMRIVVIGDFEELTDRLEGTLKMMREIAKIAGKKG